MNNKCITCDNCGDCSIKEDCIPYDYSYYIKSEDEEEEA